MFTRIITLEYLTFEMPTYKPNPIVQNLINQYKSSKKLLSRDTVRIDNKIIDTWVWKSIDDFIEFYCSDDYTDYRYAIADHSNDHNINITIEVIE